MTATICSREGCGRTTIAKGLCGSHYQSQRKAAQRAKKRAEVRNCANCGDEFSGRRPNAIYCSPECKLGRHEALRAQAVAASHSGRICAQCGAAIPEDRNVRAATCSPKCGDDRANANKRAARLALRGERRCPRCGAEITADAHGGRIYCSAQCKHAEHDERWRARSPHYMRQYLYGIDAAQFEAMVEAQGNRCAICHGEWDGKNKVPHVDHDHETGRVRGLLCESCNLGLGKFKDSAGLLRAAAAYLG